MTFIIGFICSLILGKGVTPSPRLGVHPGEARVPWGYVGLLKHHFGLPPAAMKEGGPDLSRTGHPATGRSLAAFILIWIIYCMFFKERHRSEAHQYTITDLRRKNYEIAQEHEESSEKVKEVTAGIFILPSRRREESYDKRPDYPESASHMPRMEKLIEIFDDSTLEVDKKCGTSEAEAYQSDV